MKYLFLLVVIFIGCRQEKAGDTAIQIEQGTEVDTASGIMPLKEPPKSTKYSNARFRDVRVFKISDSTYTVTGKAQIFEAAFSWVVEDGHNELKEGHEMTDAGAPEWGNFSFNINVKKERENSTLMLLLFESSAKDGSRQYELPIALDF